MTVRALKKDYGDHLQIMYAQRRKLEQITQSACNEHLLVENSDKCGDDCLYLPNSSRSSSANVSMLPRHATVGDALLLTPPR